MLKLSLGLLIHNTLVPIAAIVSWINDSVIWAGIEYRRRCGKVASAEIVSHARDVYWREKNVEKPSTQI